MVKIHTFENIILKQITELMEMELILKNTHLRENFMGIASLTFLAQLSKVLIICQQTYLKIMCLNKLPG